MRAFGKSIEFAGATEINNCDLRIENHGFLPVDKSKIYCLPAILHEFCGFASGKSVWRK